MIIMGNVVIVNTAMYVVDVERGHLPLTAIIWVKNHSVSTSQNQRMDNCTYEKRSASR